MSGAHSIGSAFVPSLAAEELGVTPNIRFGEELNMWGFYYLSATPQSLGPKLLNMARIRQQWKHLRMRHEIITTTPLETYL